VVSFHHSHCLGAFEQSERGVVLFETGTYLFSWHPGEPFAAWNRGAAWKVALPGPRGEVPHVEVEPLLLDGAGLPERATGTQAEQILRQIERHSQRLHRRDRLAWWRLSEMVKPGYLRLAAINYGDMARRKGIRHMLQSVVEGARAQLR
jgi:hypothetical protein